MVPTDPATVEQMEEQRGALVGRLFQSALGLIDLYSIYLGDRLGLYRALADLGSVNARQLAEHAGTSERYMQEWLEQQAVTGLLEVDDATAGVSHRRYRLPAGHAEVLLDSNSLFYLAPISGFVGAFSMVLPDLVQVYRTGGGIPWSAYGEDGRTSQAALNRPVFINLLGTEWLPSIPGLHERLQSDPPARVADIGCGAGWSSIAIAQAYPRVQVDGFDVDAPSIELARANAQEAGVADRVRFHVGEAESVDGGGYQLVAAFEMVHDVPRPVEVLTAMRRLAAADSVVLVMDERTAESFTAPGDDVERFFYGASILCCLPVGLSETPSAGTGTVMRAATFRGYARAAGFGEVEILPIEHDFFRIYRLRS